MKRPLAAILMCIAAVLPGGSSKAQTTTAPIKANPGTGTRLWVDDLITKNTPFVDARQFGVVPSTTVDQSAAINKAIAYAVANGYSRILLPSGQFLLNRAINLTNFNNAQLIGAGSALGYDDTWGTSQTRLICNTGTVCIDTNGSSNQLLENFTLGQASTNPSTIGILQGRNSTNEQTKFSQFNKLLRITIHFWLVNGTANGGRGTIGVYNVGAEITTYELTYVRCGEPFLLADTNILHVSSPYQPTFSSEKVPQSMTNVAFVNSWGTGLNLAAAGFLELSGHVTQNINLYATGSTGDSAGGGPTVAIILRDDASALRIHGGQWENYYSFMSIYASRPEAADSLSIDTDVVCDASIPWCTGGTTGMINLYANGQSSFFIVWSDVKIKQYPSQVHPFFGTVDPGANWRGGTLDIASSSGINSPNLALANVTIKASGLYSKSISVQSGSNYFLLANDGQRFVGGLTIDSMALGGSAPTASGETITGTDAAGPMSGLSAATSGTTAFAGSAQQPANKLEGAWIARLTSISTTPDTPLAQWTYIWSPDPSGRRAALRGSVDVNFGPVAAGSSPTQLIGEAVMTGPDTAAINAMWYGIQKHNDVPSPEEITYIGTVAATIRFIAPDKMAATDHFKIYLPSADADGDGIPDPGSVPVNSFDATTLDTRIPSPQTDNQ